MIRIITKNCLEKMRREIKLMIKIINQIINLIETEIMKKIINEEEEEVLLMMIKEGITKKEIKEVKHAFIYLFVVFIIFNHFQLFNLIMIKIQFIVFEFIVMMERKKENFESVINFSSKIQNYNFNSLKVYLQKVELLVYMNVISFIIVTINQVQLQIDFIYSKMADIQVIVIIIKENKEQHLILNKEIIMDMEMMEI